MRKTAALLLVVLMAIATTAAARTQCVSIEIEAFNLFFDLNCSITNSRLVRSTLPDQVFLNDLGFPAAETCFVIVNPHDIFERNVPGTIHDPETGRTVDVRVSGVAGLTLNAFGSYGEEPPPLSFTAATVVSLRTDGEDGDYFGSLVTRDAGTVFPGEKDDRYDDVAAARLSVAAGTGKLKGAVGYIDEVGQEFSWLTPENIRPGEPASATGKLCGKRLVDYLMGDYDDDYGQD